MFTLIGQQGVGKRPICSSSNSSVKLPKLAPVRYASRQLEEKTNIASSTSIASSTFMSSEILLSSSIMSDFTNLSSRTQESDTPIYPESEDGALCTILYHMYLKDTANPAAGIGFYEGLK